MPANIATIDDEVEEYLCHIKNVRRYSDHTIIAYKTDLRQFTQFCNKNLLTINRNEVRLFMLSLRAKNYSYSSVNRKLEVLKSFYRYHRRFSDFRAYPCSYISPLRHNRPRGNFIPVEKVKKILNATRPGANKKKVRDQLVMELLYSTGCRSSEIINLKKDDIDFAKLQIKVLGKGKIERLIPINKRVILLMEKHLKLWGGKNTGPYLLTNNKGMKIYPMYLWRLIRRYFKQDAIRMKVSAHTFRHSFATHLYRNRAPIHAIQELLGHRSLKSTSVYLHLDIQTLIRIHRKAHPR